MKNLPLILFVLGVLFFVQAGIISTQFPLTEPSPWRLELMDLYVREVRISQCVTGLSGSLFGCLGCWLLALYLKIRKLEREINIRNEAAVTVPKEEPSTHPRSDDAEAAQR